MKNEYRFKETDDWIEPLSRRFAGTARMWPKISNQLAREVVKTARQMLPGDTHRGPAFDDPENCPPEIHEYQMWVSERLEASGLAKGLAGGPAMLPDATAHLPWPWRYLAQRYGPKNYHQQARLMISNLEWYLDQSRVLRDPWTIASEQFPISMIFTVLLMASLWMATPLHGVGWFLWLVVFVLIFAFCFGVQLIWGRDSHKHKTNCAEFYYYVMQEYADAEQVLPEHEFDLCSLHGFSPAISEQAQ